MIRLLVLVSVLVLSTIVDSTARAETVEFTDTVRVVMGSRESQDECRVYATQEAKRRVLDKVGVYLTGSTEIVRKVQESFGTGSVASTNVNATTRPSVASTIVDATAKPTGAFSDSTSVLTRIQTLTVGVVQTEVVSEEWKSEGGSFVLYLVCRVKVDPEDALARLTELLKDKQKVEDYQKVQEEVERLRGDLAQLRLDLESAKTEKEKVAVKEEVQEKINGLTAVEWFEKGNNTIDIDDKIACYSLAIQMNPNLSGPYNNRGLLYVEKDNFDGAIADYSHELQLADSIRAFGYYHNRAVAFALKREFDKSLTDFDHVLQIHPAHAKTYKARGLVYILKGDKIRAREDLQRAVDLGDEDAKRLLETMK